MTTDLELACNELGWGDAEGGLWFIGLEEAEAWIGEVPALRERVRKHFDHPDPFRPPELDAAREPSNLAKEKRYRVREIQAKICAGLVSQDKKDWRAWIWKRGSKVAQANLLPLGRPSHSEWPKGYTELFGVSQSEYRSRVEGLRFPRFRSARDRLKPQAIVCFGSNEHDAFAKCFEIERKSFRMSADRKLRIYDAERVLMTPFFDYRHVGGPTIPAIVEILRGWEVRIGPVS